MNMPNVVNVGIDEKMNIRYEVVAYRQLSAQEIKQAVILARSMMKKKPKRNSVCRFVTLIGSND